jgi:integrase
MVQPQLPGVKVPAQISQYWNPSVEAIDAEKKKYRAIPVPALLNPKQKHIDDATRLELLVDHLATKGDFDDFDIRKLQGLPPEDIAHQISMWADEVNAAPPEKKESASRSFGGHLEDFGASIGRGLLGGVNKVMGIPGVTPVLSAISMPGEEVTAQILYNFAKMIPGEQDIERGVKQWKEDNPDAPWWKQGFLTPAVREHGFGVPMGVHLPMEIIFDPLNLIPVGAVFKLRKPTAVMLKLMGKGKNAPEAFRLTRRLQRSQKYANEKARMLKEEVLEAERRAFEMDFDVVGTDPYSGAPRSRIGARLWAATGRRIAGGSGEEEISDTMAAYQRLVEDPYNSSYANQIDKNNQLLNKDRLSTSAKDIDDSIKQIFEIGEVQEYDLSHLPGVRGIPLHGSEKAKNGLWAIAHDDEFWARMKDGYKAKWALQLMWYTGIRPHEIKYIEWNDILEMLKDTGPGDKVLRLSTKEAGEKTAKQSNRIIDPEAVKFFQRYHDAPEALGGRGGHNPSSAGFTLPAMRKGDASEVSHLNELFRDAARDAKHVDAYGEGLLKFYENNGNFSYIFRLSKANEVFTATKKTHGLTRLMRMMGHASTVHTARYVSFFQHRFNTKTKNILEDIAGNTTEIEMAVNVANDTLAKGKWRDALDADDLKKLESTGSVGIWSTINLGTQNRKGFSNPTRLAAKAQQDILRKDIIRASLSKELDGEFIFPVSLREGAVGVTKEQVQESLAAVHQLQNMALSLQETMIQKRFIGNIKELKSKAGLPKETRDELTKIRAEAKADAVQMQEWIQPLLDVAGEHLDTLSRVTGQGLVDQSLQTGYALVADTFAHVFKYLEMMELNRIDFLAKEGSGRGGAKLDKVADKFKLLFNMKGVTPTTRVPNAAAIKARKRFDEAGETPLTEDEIAEINRFRETSNTGWIIQPRQHGTNIKNTGKIMEDSITEANPAGLPGNPKYRSTAGQDNWMVTGWLAVDGSIFDPTVHTLQEVGAALVTKLGAKTYRGDMINLAQKPQTFEIPVLDLDAWVLAREEPVHPTMVKLANYGGTSALTANEVAEHLFKIGKTPDGTHNMKSIQLSIEREFTGERLRRNMHLLTQEGGKFNYRWSPDVEAAFKKRMDEHPEEFGYGKMGEPPKPPPSRPGASTDGGEFDPEWAKFDWKDHTGRTHTDLSEVIVIPRAMEQVMQWANTEWTKLFKKLPPVLYKPLSKVTRSAVGHTAGATRAAQLRWTFYMSKMEGQEVASNLGHMLDDMHIDMGSDRTTGRGTTLAMRQVDITSPNKGIDPRTGKFEDEMRIYEDYYRKEGWEIGPEHELFDADVAKAMDKPADANQILGPVAVMEAQFKLQNKTAPTFWDYGTELNPGAGRINAQRRKFNHLEVMQDMTTFLNSHRDDVIRLYDLSTAVGQKQLAWWDKYHQVLPHLYDLMRKSGFDIDKDRSILGKITSEFRPSFTPSQLLDQQDEIMLKGASSLGAVPSHMQSRLHHWQIQNMMEQGAARGIIDHKIYSTDPVIAIQRTAEAYYDWIGRQKFMDEYSRLGYMRAELEGHKGIADSLRKVINAKSVAESKAAELNPAQQRQAVKFFGPNYASLTSEGLEDRVLELQKMSLAWKELGNKEIREVAPPTHKLHDTALPENASLELKSLIKDIFEPQTNFITVPSTISNMMRLLSTGADLGVMLLHGIGGIGIMASPSPFIGMKQRSAWGKGVWNMARALKDPRVRTEWYTMSQLIRRDMAKYGVGFFRSTHIEDLPLPGQFTKGQRRPELERPGVKQALRGVEKLWVPAERMMQGFGFFLDVSKTEMWKVQSAAIRRNAGALDDAGEALDPSTLDTAARESMEYELNDLAAAMNAIHGTLQPAVVGIPQKQRVFESAFLMYAALYRRSAVAMINNTMSGIPETIYKAAHGDMAGAGKAWQKRKWRRGQALAAVSGMLTAGWMIGAAIKESGLNDDVFDWGSADFMSVKIGGMRLGIGTPYYTFIRMAKDLVDQMIDDPAGYGEVNFSDNALLKWFRSGSSPVTSIGIDVLSGADFIGDPLRDTTGGWEVNKIGRRVERNLIPFWLDSLGESLIGSRELHPSASLAEFFGLRVSPMSPYGRLKAAKNVAILLSTDPDIVKWREETEAAGLPVNGDTIPKLWLEKLVENSDEMKALELEISADVQHRGSYDRKRQDTYINQVTLNREGDGSPEDGGVTGLNLKLQGVEDEFLSGLLSGRDFRKKVELLEAENRGRNQQLAFTFSDVVEHFEVNRVDRVDDPAGYFVLDHWYDLYRTFVTSAADLHDEYGNFDVEMFKVRQTWFHEQVDARFKKDGVAYGWDYIQGRRTHGKLLPETMKRLEKARNETLLPFWELADQLGSRNADIVNAWRGQHTKEGKAYYQKKHRIVMVLLRRLDRIQDRYRRRNPEIDALLVEFYDYKALTNAGRVIERKRRLSAINAPPAMKAVFEAPEHPSFQPGTLMSLPEPVATGKMG